MKHAAFEQSRTGKLYRYHLCLCSDKMVMELGGAGKANEGVDLEKNYVILPSNRKQRQRTLEAWQIA